MTRFVSIPPPPAGRGRSGAFAAVFCDRCAEAGPENNQGFSGFVDIVPVHAADLVAARHERAERELEAAGDLCRENYHEARD